MSVDCVSDFDAPPPSFVANNSCESKLKNVDEEVVPINSYFSVPLP
jgi:hypothetical protein